MAYDRALNAIGDPTRRAVLEILRGKGAAVGKIAEHLSVSRSAVSQHLKVLLEAGLVQVREEGTRRIYEVDAAGLKHLRVWLEEFINN